MLPGGWELLATDDGWALLAVEPAPRHAELRRVRLYHPRLGLSPVLRLGSVLAHAPQWAELLEAPPGD